LNPFAYQYGNINKLAKLLIYVFHFDFTFTVLNILGCNFILFSCQYIAIDKDARRFIMIISATSEIILFFFKEAYIPYDADDVLP
jgi:hypothetical protein